MEDEDGAHDFGENGEDEDEGEDNEEDEDEEEDEEDDLPLEVRLERAQEENEELQAIVKSLMEQITCYRDIVSKDKENDKQRMEALRAQLEEQRQLVQRLEQSASAGDALVRQRLQEAEARLAAEQEMNEKLRMQTLANLEALKQEMLDSDVTNKRLNEDLVEERRMHKQTLMQLLALQKETERPAPQLHNQEIRLRVSFDGQAIAGAELIPENDEERAKLKQENDFYREKYLSLNQTQCVLRDELGTAQDRLQKALAESRTLADELNGLKDRHTQALREIDHLKNDEGDSSSSRSVSPSTAGTGAKAGKGKGSSSSSPDQKLHGSGTTSLSGIHQEALRIYETYMLAGSKSELPLAQETKRALFHCFAAAEGVRPSMFADARAELLRHMDAEYFAEWRAAQPAECAAQSFGDVFDAAAGKSRSSAQKSASAFLAAKGHPEYAAFLAEAATFAQTVVERAVSLSDLASAASAAEAVVAGDDDSLGRSETPDSGSSSSERRHHHKKRHAHRSSQLAKSASVSPASPAASAAAAAPPLPPPPQGVGASPAVGARRMTVPSGAEDLVEMFNKPDQQQQQQQQQPVPLSSTTPSLSSSALQGAQGAQGVQRPGPATQMLGNNGRKTIRKTMRLRRLTVDGSDPSALGIASLYGGPVTPEALLPNRESAALLFSTPATPVSARTAPAPLKPPRLSKSVSAASTPVSTARPSFGGAKGAATVTGTAATAAAVAVAAAGTTSPVASKLPAPSSPEGVPVRLLQATAGSEGEFSRSSTRYMQNLEELCGPVRGHQDNSLMTTGSVKSILAVGRAMWVAHGSPSTISIYDRDRLAQRPDVPLRDVTVNSMVLAAKQVWLATSGRDLVCINPVDPLFQRELRGHAGGGIVDLAFMGKNLWTIGMDQQIGVWNVETMKLRKMLRGSVMNCIVNVAGVAWIGTVRGILRYDTATLKPIADAAPDPLNEGAAKYLKMPVTRLLPVNNYVWAVHHDESMVSVWASESKAFIGAFPAKNVVALLRVGPHVWTTSHNNLITCYDVKTFAKVGELSGMHQDWVTCLALARHHDGLRVWSGSTDSTIVLWDPLCRPHDFQTVRGRTGICDVCRRALKPSDDVLVCKNCSHYSLHLRCRDSFQLGCTCTAKLLPPSPPSSTSSSSTSSSPAPDTH